MFVFAADSGAGGENFANDLPLAAGAGYDVSTVAASGGSLGEMDAVVLAHNLLKATGD